MSNGPQPQKLDLLAAIQRLALTGDDLAVILGGAITPLMAGLHAARIAILSAKADGAAAVLAAAETEPGSFGEATTFEIMAEGLSWGVLKVERAAPLTDSDRVFASVAAGILATAFIRLEMVPRTAETPVDLAGSHVHPAGLIHRMRNILSVIRIIVRRTARSAKSVEDYAAQLEGRVAALARVQTALTTSQYQSTA